MTDCSNYSPPWCTSTKGRRDTRSANSDGTQIAELAGISGGSGVWISTVGVGVMVGSGAKLDGGRPAVDMSTGSVVEEEVEREGTSVGDEPLREGGGEGSKGELKHTQIGILTGTR